MKTIVGLEFMMNGKLVKVKTDYSLINKNDEFFGLVYVDRPNVSAGQLTLEHILKYIENEK